MSRGLPPDADVPGALCPDNPARADGSGHGPLRGLAFAVEDVFDVAGSTAGNGHPAWLRGHAPAGRNAVAVQRLLDARNVRYGVTENL